jgi:hypothetical protein
MIIALLAGRVAALLGSAPYGTAEDVVKSSVLGQTDLVCPRDQACRFSDSLDMARMLVEVAAVVAFTDR